MRREQGVMIDDSDDKLIKCSLQNLKAATGKLIQVIENTKRTVFWPAYKCWVQVTFEPPSEKNDLDIKP